MNKKSKVEDIKPVTLPEDAGLEIGTRGEMLVSSYNSEEWRVDDLTIRDYRRMKDNDGQVQMLLSAIYGTLLSTGVQFMDDDDYENNTQTKTDSKDKTKSTFSEEHDFIQANLTNPRWKNGMSRSFLLTNKTNLRALEEGYRVSEIIYRIDDDGMIRLDRLAPRGARLTDYELKIITDDNGNYYGFHQLTYFRSGVIDVIVVNDSDIMKTINVVWGEEYGSNYGRSALKPIWYHYDKAHKGMYLNHVGHELGATKYRKVVKKAVTTATDDNNLLDVLQKVGQNGVVMYQDGKYDVIFESVSDAAVMAVGKDMIAYHTSQMSKAFLAQFIDLGSNMSSSGSRALGQTGKEFFRSGLQYMATLLIEEPWNKIIADLIKMNFNRGIYPYIKLDQIEEKDVDLIYDSFMELVKNGKISDKTSAQLETKAVDNLGLDVTEEDIEESQEERKTQALDAKPDTSNGYPSPEADVAKLEMSEPEQNGMRPLYLDEQKVKISTIKNKIADAYTRSNLILRNRLDSQKDAIINQFVLASRKGISDIRNIKVELAEGDMTYSDELKLLATEMMEFGKFTAANELNKAIPATTKKNRSSLLANVILALQDQMDRLELRLQMVTNKAVGGNLGENDLKTQLSNEYDSFFTTILAPTIGAIIPDSFNIGRQSVFNTYANDIFAYRYTSVLEANTCDYCRSLDGSVFQASDPNYAMLQPPQHFNCLCFYTPITNEEADIQSLDVTGKPDDIPVYSSLSSFKGLPQTELVDKHQHNQDVFLSDDVKEIEEVLATLEKSGKKLTEELLTQINE